MELTVNRCHFSDESTIGELFVDDTFECYTLEDVMREKPGVPVSDWKIAKQTAIPVGRYKIELYNSPHFGRIVPMLIGVSGFRYVLIHWGNDAIDTDGCILVGQHRSEDYVRDSVKAFDALFPKIQDAISSGEEVWITINNQE